MPSSLLSCFIPCLDIDCLPAKTKTRLPSSLGASPLSSSLTDLPSRPIGVSIPSQTPYPDPSPTAYSARQTNSKQTNLDTRIGPVSGVFLPGPASPAYGAPARPSVDIAATPPPPPVLVPGMVPCPNPVLPPSGTALPPTRT